MNRDLQNKNIVANDDDEFDEILEESVQTPSSFRKTEKKKTPI